MHSEPQQQIVEKKQWVKPAATAEEVADVTKASPTGIGKDGAACHS